MATTNRIDPGVKEALRIPFVTACAGPLAGSAVAQPAVPSRLDLTDYAAARFIGATLLSAFAMSSTMSAHCCINSRHSFKYSAWL